MRAFSRGLGPFLTILSGTSKKYLERNLERSLKGKAMLSVVVRDM